MERLVHLLLSRPSYSICPKEKSPKKHFCSKGDGRCFHSDGLFSYLPEGCLGRDSLPGDTGDQPVCATYERDAILFPALQVPNPFNRWQVLGGIRTRAPRCAFQRELSRYYHNPPTF